MTPVTVRRRTTPTPTRTGKPAKSAGYGSISPMQQARPAYADILGRAAPQRPQSSPYASYFNQSGQVNPESIASGLDANFRAANDNNQFRYQQALDLASGSLGESMGYLEKYGNDAKDRIGKRERDATSGIDADAISRGVYGMGYISGEKRNIQTEADRERAAIDERANMLRSDVSRQGYGDIINLVTSRTDQTPNVDSYVGLLQQQAALRAEREARQKDTTTLQGERANDNANQVTAIVNGVPQYGGGVQMGRGGMFNNAPANLGAARSATSMGGRQLTAPLSAGTAYNPYEQFIQQPQQQPAFDSRRAVYAPAGYMSPQRRAANRPVGNSYRPGATSFGSNRPR